MAASLRRDDLLSLCNLRADGRRSHEPRRLDVRLGVLGDAGRGGSAVVRCGLTTVAASVTGPHDHDRRGDERNDRASVVVTLRVTSFASTVPSGVDRRTIGGQTDSIRKAVETAVETKAFPRSVISIDVTVLTDDGGRLCTAINAATCALVDAGIPMKDLVCACDVGVLDGDGDEIAVDLNRRERRAHQGVGSRPSAYLCCAVLPQRNTVVLSQCESRISLETYEKLLDAAIDACRKVFNVMRTAVRERAATMLAVQGGNVQVRLHPSLTNNGMEE